MPTEISGSTGVNKIQDGTVVAGDLASSVNLGKIIATYTDQDNSAVQTTSKESWTSTAAAITLTPASTSSKFHIVANACQDLNHGSDYSSAPDVTWSVTRAISGGATTNNVTSSPNWRIDARGGSTLHNTNSASMTMVGIDSPNTTSAITYTVKFYNQSWGDFDGAVGTRYDTGNGGYGGANITIMEIAG